MNRLHLILDLPVRTDRPAEFIRQTAPCLAALLSRGEASPGQPGLTAALARAHLLEPTPDWPLAPICAAADGLASATGYWLRLDPVHLEVAMGGLILHPGETLQLSPHEAAELIIDINRHWWADRMRLHAPNPARWYFAVENGLNMHTTPLDQMVGEYVTPHLPRGEDAPRFLRLINEVQMLLHSHPVNLAREAAGQATVNGLWIWGGGMLPIVIPRFDLVAGDAFELQAMAQLCGVSFMPQPPALIDLPACRQALLALTQTRETDPVLHMQQLERDWFRPLLRLLQRGGIAHLQLDLIGYRSVALSPWHGWKLWR